MFIFNYIFNQETPLSHGGRINNFKMIISYKVLAYIYIEIISKNITIFNIDIKNKDSKN